MATRLVQQALTLIARMHGGDHDQAAAAEAALVAWRRGSPAREAAFREADARWRSVGGVAAKLRQTLAEPLARSTTPGQRARRIAGSGAALGLLLLAAAAIHTYLTQPIFEADYQTSTAQLRHADLPDGSGLDLDARTRLRVRYFPDRRTVDLESGEARFDVTREPGRPFIVTTRAGTVHVLGTAVTVAERGGTLTVSVERGVVTVSPLTGGAAPIRLEAGHRVIVVAGRPGPVERIALERIGAWRSGWLVFDDTPLEEALRSINAYSPRPITLGDARAGRQRVTGSFRAAAPAAILDALPRILPVEVQATAGGGMEIVSRR